MSAEDVHQPHDKLFKLGFRNPDDAAAFLRVYLPERLAALIAWEALRPEPDSFIDSQMIGSQADLLFSALLRGGAEQSPGALIYLLLEHLGEPRRWTALTLLRYMVRIWELRLQSKPPPERLPIILPVVLLQSGSGHWRMPAQFAELLDIPAALPPDAKAALAGFIPDFTFRLIELATVPFEAIAGSPSGVLVLRLLKAETLGALMGEDVWDESLLAQVPETLMVVALRYILDRADVDIADLTRKVSSLSEPTVKTAAMSLAEKLVQEGLEKGLEKGQVLSLQTAILEVLDTRFSLAPEGLCDSVRAISDLEHLRRLHRRALTSSDLESFAQGL